MANMQERLNSAVTMAETDSALLHDVVHGTDTDVVITEGGEVPSVANVIKNIRNSISSGANDIITIATDAKNVAVEAKDSILNNAGFKAVSADLLQDNHIGTVAENLDDIQNLGPVSQQIANVAEIKSQVVAVAGNNGDITNVANNITAIKTAVTNINNINSAAANIESIKTVNQNKDNIDAVVASIENVKNVGENIQNVKVVAEVSDEVTAVAGIKDNITKAVENLSAINKAAENANIASSSATGAKTSETNAQTAANKSAIWAEGEDSEVSNIGGTHSCKRWWELVKEASSGSYPTTVTGTATEGQILLNLSDKLTEVDQIFLVSVENTSLLPDTYGLSSDHQSVVLVNPLSSGDRWSVKYLKDFRSVASLAGSVLYEDMETNNE